MSSTVIVINALVVCCLVVSFVRDRARTRRSLLVAAKSLLRILPTVLIVIVFIGLLLGFVSPERISGIVGEQSGFGGVLPAALLGALLHIPALISFPLAASLLESGASVTVVAVFITTLTMIGVVTLPLEIKELGKRMALLRNGMSFIIAILIALIMGRIL